MGKTLDKLEGQWLDLWDSMPGAIEHPAITPAAPFFSVGPYPRNGRAKPSILFVGKATHSDWRREPFLAMRSKSTKARVEERKNATLDFLQKCSGTDKSAFWAHYRMVSHETGADVIWTNVAKIGVSRPRGEKEPINPWGKCLRVQAHLAQ
jgi:hypothetical protein